MKLAAKGLLVVAGLGVAVIAEAGKNQVSSLPTWLTLESVYYLLQFGITGTVIGLVYGREAGDVV